MGAFPVSLLLAVAVALLLVAAWRDVATRLIPDSLSAGLAITGLALRVAEAGWVAALVSLGIALALGTLLLLAAMGGALGGGDVKLAAAMACGLGPADTWDFVVLTVFAGGLLALPYLAVPRLRPAFAPALRPAGASLPARVLAVESRRLRRGGPVPYAVAIAAGGLATLLLPRAPVG